MSCERVVSINIVHQMPPEKLPELEQKTMYLCKILYLIVKLNLCKCKFCPHKKEMEIKGQDASECRLWVIRLE